MAEISDIRITQMSAAKGGGRHLLCCEDRYFEANDRVADLVKTLQLYPDSLEAGIDAYVEKCGGRYSARQIADFVDKSVKPILRPTNEKERRRQFMYEKELLSAQAVDRFSDALSCLFNRWVMWAVIAVTLAADVWFMTTASGLWRIGSDVDVYVVFGLMAFMGFSSFFHELGHASACKHYGIRHGGIGFGMYLTFPVLYTDVTRIWELSRRRRMTVNLAGVYFQCFILLALIGLYWLTGYDMLRYLALAMNLGFLLVMNPFFRFDGYWIASDLLGVPNLRRHSQALLGYLWKRLLRRPAGDKPYLLRLQGWEKWGLAVYSIAVTAFMSYYFFYLIPMFLYRFAMTFPQVATEIFTYLASGLTPPFALLHNALGQLLFLAMIGYMIYGLARPYYKRFRACLKINVADRVA